MADCPSLPSYKAACSGPGCYGADELRLAFAISEALVFNPPAFMVAPGTAIIIEDSGGDELEVNADGSINVVFPGTASLDVNVFDGAGTTAITSTGTALDVNIASGSLTLSQATDSVAIGDGTDLIDINADGSVNVTDNGGSLTVDDGGGSLTIDGSVSVSNFPATQTVAISQAGTDNDVDISNEPSVNLQDGAGTDITSTGGALDVNIASGSVTVTATDLDIRDLDATQDNVAISDGTDTLAVNTDGSITVQITEPTGTLTALPPQLVAPVSTTTAYSVDGSREWTLAIVVVVTSGTLDIDLEASIDGTNYYVLSSLSVSASDTFAFSTIRPHQFVRVNWTANGTGTVDADIWELA